MSRENCYIQNCSCKVSGYYLSLDHIGHTFPDSPWQSLTHCHENWELHYITAGKGLLITENKNFELAAGTLFITGPGNIHAQISDEEEQMEEYGIRINLVKKRKNTHENSVMNQVLSAIEDCRFIFTEYDFDCAHLIEEMIAEYRNSEAAARERMFCLLMSLLIPTSRCISLANTALLADSAKSIDRHIIIENYMRQYKQDITVDELAQMLYISQRQLRRIIRESYNSTMSQQKNKLRIDEARRFLEDESLSIAEISEMMGFSSQSYFSKCFKKIYGISPSDYRKQLGKTE